MVGCTAFDLDFSLYGRAFVLNVWYDSRGPDGMYQEIRLFIGIVSTCQIATRFCDSFSSGCRSCILGYSWSSSPSSTLDCHLLGHLTYITPFTPFLSNLATPLQAQPLDLDGDFGSDIPNLPVVHPV